MPSYRTETPSISLQHFDVVGEDGRNPGLVTHTGLAKSAGNQSIAKIPVIEMGPPLRDEGGNMAAHVIGSAVLTDDEVHKIRTFVERHLLEHLAFLNLKKRALIKSLPQIYRVYPHTSPYTENDGRYARRRFSCVGFVFEAYKTARIKLLQTSTLPSAEIAQVRMAYHNEITILEKEGIGLEEIGLKGDGPWPIMFCGYLFHALNRDGAAIRQEPFLPDLADIYFPRQPPANTLA